MALLPSVGVLQSCLNNSYVGYIQDESPLNGYIHFKNSVFNPVHEQLAFEPSKIVPGCYHIRCIYNNKYWTRKSSTPGSPIVATAKQQKPKEAKEPEKGEGGTKIESKEPEKVELEPETKALDWDSTLFKVERYANDIISIQHMSTKDQLSIKVGNGDGAEAKSSATNDDQDEELAGCLIALKDSITDTKKTGNIIHEDPISFGATLLPYVFRIIDLDNFILLPGNVALKADNGLYYQTQSIPGAGWGPNLQASGRDTDNIACHHEISHDSNGFTMIRARSNNNYWDTGAVFTPLSNTDTSTTPKSSQRIEWITAIPPGPSGMLKFTLRCRAFRVGSNKIFLTSTQWPQGVLSRQTQGNYVNCLGILPNTTTPIPTAIMEVEEPVRQRLIDNVAYRIDDARIFDEEVIHVSQREYYNHDPNGTPTFHEYFFSERERTVSTWTAHLGLNLAINVRIRAGIPFIKNMTIEVGGAVEGSYTWGQETERETEVRESGTIEAAPGTMVRVVLVATRGQFELPFSYTQHDITTDWRNEVRNLDDGNYIGGGIYNFRVDITRHPL